MAKELLIIKVGGSVITHKDSITASPNIAVIENIASQISSLFQSNNYQIILIHGAGSYGHPIAKKYKTYKGISSDQTKIGVGLTQNAMMKLSTLITEKLLKLSTPSIVVHPHDVVTQSNKSIKTFEIGIIETYLREDYIPVLYGDTVLDDAIGCSILSGDTIACYLAKILKADKVIFLSNVDGIFDANPIDNDQANLIESITNDNFDRIIETITINNPNDISEEMKGKLLRIKEFLTGKEVMILNGLKKDNLVAFLNGKAKYTSIQL